MDSAAQRIAGLTGADDGHPGSRRRRASADDDHPDDVALASLHEQAEDTDHEGDERHDEGDDSEGDDQRREDDDQDHGADPDGDGGDEDDDPEFLGRKVRVKVNGVEAEIPVSELRKGYQRQRDYTQKTEQLAAVRREVETHAVAVLSQRQALDGLLAQQVHALNQFYGAEPDWDSLYQSNPLEFVRQRAAFDKRNGEMQQLANMRAQNAHIATQQQAYARSTAVAAEGARMLERHPEWRDPVKGKAAKERLVKYAQTMGYSPQDLAGISDSRHLTILDKAERFDALMERARQRTIGQRREPRDEREDQAPAPPRAPRTAPPGPAPAQRRPTPRKELDAAKQRAARTGKPEDAARAIENLL